MTSLAAGPIGERLAGRRPARARALLAAGAAGVMTAALVYRLLRSGGATTKGG